MRGSPAELAVNGKYQRRECCAGRARTPRPPSPALDKLHRLDYKPPGVAREGQAESERVQPIDQLAAAPDEHCQPAQKGQQTERMRIAQRPRARRASAKSSDHERTGGISS